MKNIVTTYLKERYPLTKVGSTKETYHITLTSETLEFKPGDSLGIYAQNDPGLVEHLIEALGATGEESITDTRSGQLFSLRAFLTHKANLSRLTSALLKLIYECDLDHQEKNRLSHLLDRENQGELKHYLDSHDPLDLFKEYRQARPPLQEICSKFGPLLPRFYSVASSLLVHPGKVDLTVALFTYTHSGERRYGVASHFLCHLAEESTPIPVYVQPAHRFALPTERDAPIVMIGPGTGIAPFRAFMQERVFHGSKGKNWLFFGERNQAYDYLYGEFWKELAEKNLLHLSLAFSRDQEHKIYVQDRMREAGADLWAWLQEGALFYICGDASHMARDVEHAMIEIFQVHGSMSEEEAKTLFKHLKKEGRYLTDVY